jgi:hypothetical protein
MANLVNTQIEDVFGNTYSSVYVKNDAAISQAALNNKSVFIMIYMYPTKEAADAGKRALPLVIDKETHKEEVQGFVQSLTDGDISSIANIPMALQHYTTAWLKDIFKTDNVTEVL